MSGRYKTRAMLRRMGPMLAFAWLAALFLAFTLVQMPLTLEIAAAVGRTLIDGLAVAILTALAGALGTLMISAVEGLTAVERAAVRLLVGFTALGLAVLLVGMLGLFPPVWLGWLIMIGLLAAMIRPLRRWWADVGAGLRELAAPPEDGFTRWLRRGALLMLGLALLVAFAPPTKWDALVYHLANPQTYLEAGRIVGLPDNHFSSFPHLTEMLYMWLMIVARANAAAALHAVFGGVVLVLTLALARRAGKPSAGWVAVIILLASNTFWQEFHWPYNDLALIAYTMGALVVVMAWDADKRDRYLIIAGLLTGSMMSQKYTAASYTVGVGLLVLWLARRGGAIRALRAVAMVALVALAVFVPWLVKNLILEGNPLAPFLWGTAGFDELDQWYYLRPGTGLSPVELLLSPLQATVFGSESTSYQATAGPLLVGMLPLAAIGWRRRDAESRQFIQRMLIFVLPGCVVWFAGAASSWFLLQTRLLYPIFPMLALVGALGLDGLRSEASLAGLYKLGQGIVLASMGVAVVGAGLDTLRAAPLPVTFGLQAEDDYLLGQLGAHYGAMQAVNDLPEDASVLFLWEPRTYYCQRDCEPDSMINNWWHDREVYGSPEAIAEHWRERGYTHVLIYEAGGRFLIEKEPYDPMIEADWDALATLREQALEPVWDEIGSYTLYRLVEVGE